MKFWTRFVCFIMVAGMLFAHGAGGFEKALASEGVSAPLGVPLLGQYRISQQIGRDQPGYHAQGAGDRFVLHNPGQEYEAYFSSAEAVLTASSLTWDMGLKAWGYDNELSKISPQGLNAQDNQVTYDYGALSEWYVNGPLGLQQGFTLEAPPQGSGQFLVLELGGPERATVSLNEDKTALSVRSPQGETLVNYQGLMAWDSTGRMLPVSLAVETRGHPALTGEVYPSSVIRIQVVDDGAEYPITVDPWIQHAKLTALDGLTGDRLGDAVDVEEEIVVVGAPDDAIDGKSSQGSAYIFKKPGSRWSDVNQIAKLTASDGLAADYFGVSVAIDGDTVVVGADNADVDGNTDEGAVYVFQKPSGGWQDMTETAKLTAASGAANDYFGTSVDISSDTIVIGAWGVDIGDNYEQGLAYIFEKPGADWVDMTETAQLSSSTGAAGNEFGTSVAIDGDVVAVGEPGTDISTVNEGSAEVFVKPGGGWTNKSGDATLTADDYAAYDELGTTIAVDGDTVVVGAPLDDGTSDNEGAAYVYDEPQGGWMDMTQTAKLISSSPAQNDELGASIAISDDMIVLGAHKDNPGGSNNQGMGYVYLEPTSGWVDTTENFTLHANDGGEGDLFGAAVGVHGNTIVFGAPGENNSQGAAYVFETASVADFDGDGSTDISVYRPSNGNWYVKDQGYTSWGLTGDLPVPGDYDGDGETDVAVFRPSNGKWYVKDQGIFNLGQETDVPVPCDYDGDGDDDVAVYRPDEGTWHILGEEPIQWGFLDDIPVPADYDGNGVCDIAVFRPTNGNWYVMGQGATSWAHPGDIPVPADYDGDGQDEITVYRPSNGNWYVMGIGYFSWGFTDDIPVPGDYDGDGDDDIAVLRESNGKWYIMGLGNFRWYYDGDYPLPVRDTNADGTPYQ